MTALVALCLALLSWSHLVERRKLKELADNVHELRNDVFAKRLNEKLAAKQQPQDAA